MHARKYANAARTCDVIFANSAFTADDVAATLGFPRERVVVAHPGIGAEFTRRRRGAPTSAGRTCSTVATLEPRKNLGTLVEAHALLARHRARARRRRAAQGWGEQPRARPAGRRPARPRRRRGARAPLPRRRGGRLPVAVRGLRDADHRGDGLRRAGRRVVAPVARRGVRRRCGPCRSRERRGDRGRGPRGARRGATSCARRASRTRRRFSWRRNGELFLEGYRRFS